MSDKRVSDEQLAALANCQEQPCSQCILDKGGICTRLSVLAAKELQCLREQAELIAIAAKSRGVKPEQIVVEE